ncbi:MAG: hypothetical protein HY904_07890 [Deltaproteobacteria bacterium]|nr:hypothetical protein [Deltaproteobacteria bacterium]
MHGTRRLVRVAALLAAAGGCSKPPATPAQICCACLAEHRVLGFFTVADKESAASCEEKAASGMPLADPSLTDMRRGVPGVAVNNPCLVFDHCASQCTALWSKPATCGNAGDCCACLAGKTFTRYALIKGYEVPDGTRPCMDAAPEACRAQVETGGALPLANPYADGSREQCLGAACGEACKGY